MKPITAFSLLLLLGAATPTIQAAEQWKKFQLTDQYYAEGASFGDINKDGKSDVVAGPYWYEGPDFKAKHEFYPAKVADLNGYSIENFFSWTYDFNSDGWTDILLVGLPGLPAALFINPKKSDGAWEKFNVHPTVDNESPDFLDVDGDKKPELLCMTGGKIGYASPDWSNPTKPWTFIAISPQGPWQRFTHGLGVGDINGDGKLDILEKDGWWEQPSTKTGEPWKMHPVKFANPGGAQMFAYDVDGDGDSDVITSIAAHGYGLAWHEQIKEGGAIQFKQHILMNAQGEAKDGEVKFSQLHAMALVDINGDGLKDILTGKCWWAHGQKNDPEPNNPAVIYWFELKRKDGKASFTPHQIDDNSGVGRQLYTADANGNGKPDFVIGNKKGTFVFVQ